MVNRERIELALINNMIWVINIVLFLTFCIVVPAGFSTINNVHYILYVSGFLGFVVLAESVVLISGNFDLSVAENVGFSAMLTAVIVTSLDCSAALAGVIGIILIIIISTFLGAINGLLVGRFGLNPFLATLATYMIFFWGTLATRTSVVYGLPELLLIPGGSKVGGIWMAIPIFFVFAAIFHFVLTRTRFGSNIYAVGGDPVSSRMLGLNVRRILFYTYMLAGFLAGLSAIMWVGYIKCVPPMLADGAIFEIFAGAIIGGVSIRGGRGTVPGMIGGILFLGIVRAGLIMLGLSPPVIGTITGVLVLIAIVFDVMRGTLKDRILRPR